MLRGRWCHEALMSEEESKSGVQALVDIRHHTHFWSLLFSTVRPWWKKKSTCHQDSSIFFCLCVMPPNNAFYIPAQKVDLLNKYLKPWWRQIRKKIVFWAAWLLVYGEGAGGEALCNIWNLYFLFCLGCGTEKKNPALPASKWRRKLSAINSESAVKKKKTQQPTKLWKMSAVVQEVRGKEEEE